MSIKIGSECLLMGIDGVTYQTLLGDISERGALVSMSKNISHGLQIGEMCGIMLCDKPSASSTKHTGMIISLDSGNVGINFHHQEHHHQKKKFTT
ncbi:MAG TPA: hypothetical protein HPP97_05065 [Desulfuromonadales bacterium]|nr:hypothetical protein [Desulfuromonadales bacterium]